MRFAVWIAASPTLLDAAVTITASPSPSFATSISAPRAVTYGIQSAAAFSQPSDAGCFTASSAGTIATSPYVPQRVIDSGGTMLTASRYAGK